MTLQRTQDIAQRFQRETAEHQMTVLRDDGLYRHVRFRHPKRGIYWFDLITVPGALIFRGDGDSFVFQRLPDMFEFFRGSAYLGNPNISYWAEKLTDGRDRVMVYDQEILADFVKEEVAEVVAAQKDGTLAELEKEVQAEVLDYLCGDESLDRHVVDQFEFYANDSDRFAWPKKAPDFQFEYMYEWRCQDYDWWFVWACHGIVWGITKYDAHRKAARERHRAVQRSAIVAALTVLVVSVGLILAVAS